MFPFGGLPEQWEKRLVRYLLLRLDFLDHRSLDDLNNISGSVGTVSVFKLRDIGLKVDRLQELLKIPPRLIFKHAVAGDLTVTLPGNIFLGGAVEIRVDGVRVALDLIAPPPEATSAVPSPASTPRSAGTPRPASPLYDDDHHDLPTTAEELAQSFLESQSDAEKRQLMSIYAEDPVAASMLTQSTASVDTEGEEEEEGVGVSPGLPGFLAGMFKGVADRMIVSVKHTSVSLFTTLSQERGHEKVLLELQVDEVDIEGISRNVANNATLEESQERPRKEGKRRITLNNIRGFVSAEARQFGVDIPDLDESVFGALSDDKPEITDRKDVGNNLPDEFDAAASATTPRSGEQQKNSPSPSPIPSPPTSESPADLSGSVHSLLRPSEEGPGRPSAMKSDASRFLDHDDSDEEELAFAPPSMRSSMRPDFAHSRHWEQQEQPLEEEDSEDDVDGGAMFRQPSQRSSPAGTSPPPDSAPERSPSPTPSSMSSSTGSFASARESMFLERARPQYADENGATSGTAFDTNDPESSGDEMDEEASMMLGRSMMFSREQAKMFMSASDNMTDLDEAEACFQTALADDDDEIVDPDELDRRLDRVILGDGASTPKQSPSGSPQTEKRAQALKISECRRKIRKECIYLDSVTIYYPSLSDGVVAVEETQAPEESIYKEERGTHMPGTFSLYASRHTIKHEPPVSTSKGKGKPRVKILDALDARPAISSTEPLLSFDTPGKNADIEIIASHVKGRVDVETEKMLGFVLEAVQDALSENSSPGKSKKAKSKQQQTDNERKKSIQFLAEEVDVAMVKHLAGKFTDTGEEDKGDDSIQLQCLLNDVKLHHRGLADDASTSKLSVRKFALGDEEEGIITFLPARRSSFASVASSVSAAKMASSAHHRKRSSAGAPGGGLLGHGSLDDDIVVTFSQSPKKLRVNVHTQILNIRGNLERLEAMFGSFGGLGSVIASTSASTATITKPGGPMMDDDTSTISGSAFLNDTKVDTRIEGFVFDVVGRKSSVNLETSPIKVKFHNPTGVSVGIDKIEVTAPSKCDATAHIAVEDCRLEFANRPTQEDLGRLLELLAPSKDRYEDPDIMIDTLLRQREQGSVLRVGVADVKTEILDLTVFDRLKELGDEVMQVLAVTDFVAGDERPGLLTLADVQGIHAGVELGGGIGRINADLGHVGMTHVTAPALFALGVGSLGVRRGENEELVGMGLDRQMFSRPDFDRPAIMVRLIGEELEPVIKIKLWNLRFEYNVKTLLAMMEKPQGTTGEDITQDLVQSIVHLPEQKEKADIAALGFDLVIKDSIIGLNPLDLKSKALVILTDARLQAALPTGSSVSAGMEIEKASVMLIDDVSVLMDPERRKPQAHGGIGSDHLDGLASMGYVSVISLSKVAATLRVVGEEVDVEITDKLFLMETCPDSTQTLIAIMNGLAPPKPETEEIKYCTEVLPLEEVMKGISEDAFAPPDTTGRDFEHIEEPVNHEEQLQTNTRFVESYYGHKSPEASREDLVHALLDDDLGHMRAPPAALSRQSSSGDSIFQERINMLVDEPLNFIDNHFDVARNKRKGRNALNREAVEKADYFPLKAKVQVGEFLWNLHEGYDWQRTRDAITKAVQQVETKAAERQKRQNTVAFDLEDDDDTSVVDDFLFNSIYIGVAGMNDPRELTNQINKQLADDQCSELSYATESSRPTSSRSRGGGSRDFRSNRNRLKLGRSKRYRLQFDIKGANIDFLLFPPGSSEVQSSVEVRLEDLVIFDKMPSSTWRRFATYCHDYGEREMGSDMVRLEVLVVKPVPELAATELVIKVSILPLRLHVDQDALDFLTRFFEFKDDATNLPPPDAPQPEQPFLQRVEVNAVKVKLDYKPKRVDYAGLRSGHTTEFMNFVILEESEMTLRRVILHGISGFERMSKILNNTWMPDIQRNQLGGVLAGVAPVRSLVNLTRGARDLVVVPVREYRKDGRIIRSVQKGVNGFVRNTAGELVRLGTKVAIGTQTLLESAEGVLSGTAAAGAEGVLVEIGDEYGDDGEGTRMVSLYADQPETISQGLREASRGLRRNLREAKEAIMAVPAEMAQRGDAIGAVGAVARAAPVAVIRPMVGVSEAVGRTLMGVGNAMEPERRRQREDKYKKH